LLPKGLYIRIGPIQAGEIAFGLNPSMFEVLHNLVGDDSSGGNLLEGNGALPELCFLIGTIEAGNFRHGETNTTRVETNDVVVPA
jgi:hypothetical protein